jgi:hypothetical protein
VLAWHHAHLSYQSPPKHKRYQQHESQQWLNFAEGLLDSPFALLQTLVFEKLDAVVQASSLVELVKAFIRPYLNSSQGQITQETFNLLMVYHHHRRDKSGKRQGQAPIALLTGEALEVDWIELLIPHTQGTSPAPSLTSGSLLALVPHCAEPPTPSQMPPGQEALAPSTESDISWSPMDAAAA